MHWLQIWLCSRLHIVQKRVSLLYLLSESIYSWVRLVTIVILPICRILVVDSRISSFRSSCSLCSFSWLISARTLSNPRLSRNSRNDMDPIFRFFTIIVASEEVLFRDRLLSFSSWSSLCKLSLCCTSSLRFTGFYRWFLPSIRKRHTILIRLNSRSAFITDWLILSIWSCVRTPGLSSASCARMSRISLQFNSEFMSYLLHLFKERTGRDVRAALIFEILVLQVFDC